MRDPIELTLSIVLLYQKWCGERIERITRAQGVVEEITKLACLPSKKAAVEWLIKEDWCDLKARAKPLVDEVWKIRDDIRLQQKRAVVRAILGC